VSDEKHNMHMIKTNYVSLIAAAVLLSGCYVGIRPYGPTVAVQPLPPPVVVQTPAPMPVVSYAPEYYSWDGYEYVGLYGDQYVYWNAGAWVVCDGVRLGRFHGWERYHPGWRTHAIHYRHGREPYR
jgi:hypothetical protein